MTVFRPRPASLLALPGIALLAACDPAGSISGADIQTASVAETACLTSTAEATNVSNLTVLSSAADKVEINVPGATAPWVCDISAEGEVGAPYFTGNEGTL